MFLTMMIMLAIASTVVELMFAAKISVWRQNAYKLKWVNMLISIVLSFILGIMFGAAGIIALGAAMISTVLSIPGYAFLHWNLDSPAAQKVGGNLLVHTWTKWKQAVADLFQLIYKFIRFITAPIWITRNIINKYQAYKGAKS